MFGFFYWSTLGFLSVQVDEALDIEVKGLNDGCKTKRETDVSFKGAEDLANDWVSDPDLEARSFVIDPQSQALIELKGQTVITAIVKETFIDDASGEVIIENSIGFEIKLKGLINSFASVS